MDDRLAKLIDEPDPIWRKEIALDAAGLLPKGFRFSDLKERRPFQLAFLGRMLFSCLVDADFLDTEDFYARSEGRQVDRDWPALPALLPDLIARFDAYMQAKAATAAASPLATLRGEILAHARAKGAALAPGLFTLDVPTGGGKTLASLGFALDHARAHGLERIVYGIPFTTITEQTGRIFRDVLGADVVLEHHSAVEGSEREEGAREGKGKLKLAMENWAAPVVVTTNVQLFESLFAARTSRCRKLHNLAKAVIILDEAQTIPLHVLRPAVAALDELARNYGSTIVICTATQPALAAPRFVGGLDLKGERELAPNPPDLHARLRRVTLRLAGTMTDAALVAELADAPKGLIIVNSRKHALDLYRAAKAAGLDGLIHLTTRQTAFDRCPILAEVRRRLDPASPEPCRLIATSLVEAGVDLDFPRAWRAETGLEQLIQAAGRVNREGLRPPEESPITVFKPAEAKPPKEIEAFAAATERTRRDHPDLFTPEAIERYFREIYWQRGEGLDRGEVLDAFRAGSGETDFAYRTVAEAFRLVESGMLPVIVPRDQKARDALDRLRIEQVPSGAIARDLQTHIVQVPPRARDRLVECGHVAFREPKLRGDQFAVLEGDRYTREEGLIWEDPEYLSAESLVWF